MTTTTNVRSLRTRQPRLQGRLRDIVTFTKEKKSRSKCIADRLPKRQAKMKGYRSYLEFDEIDGDLLGFKELPDTPTDDDVSLIHNKKWNSSVKKLGVEKVKELPDNNMELDCSTSPRTFSKCDDELGKNENITKDLDDMLKKATRKRKFSNKECEVGKTSQETFLVRKKRTQIPVKKSRIEKVERKALRGKDHKRALFRKFKRKPNNITSFGSNKKESGISTRARTGNLRGENGDATTPTTVQSEEKPGDIPTTTDDKIEQSLKSTISKTAQGLNIIRKREKIKIRRLKESGEEIHLKRRLKLTKMVGRKNRSKMRDAKTEFQHGTDSIHPHGDLVICSNSDESNGKHGTFKNKLKLKSDKSIKKESISSLDFGPCTTDAPIFYPTEEEFLDPISYIQSISHRAESFGLCCIHPPNSWKVEGKLNDDVRFTTQKQLVHQLYQRFGPNVLQTKMIKKHLAAHELTDQPLPVIGGIEIDICKLSRIIEELGGTQSVEDKKTWLKAADLMSIPKTTQERGTKLFDAYCHFLVSYLSLTEAEVEQLKDEVNKERLDVTSLLAEDECMVKGRSVGLPLYQKMCKNIYNQWISSETPSDCNTTEIEKVYWKLLTDKTRHAVSHSTILTQCEKLMSYNQDDIYSKHPWNLNNLSLDNPLSALSALTATEGLTLPTMHVGMLFSTSCWSKDPHALPTVHYLHSESDVIWYGVPASSEDKFKEILTTETPTLIQSGDMWLKANTVMIPPGILAKQGLTATRCIQKQGQFVIILPQCINSNVGTGYTLLEHVHYATADWLYQGLQASKLLNRCCEKEKFSIEDLICKIIENPTVNKKLLACSIPIFQCIVQEECKQRLLLSETGLKISRRLCTPGNQSTWAFDCSHSNYKDELVTLCAESNKICHLSMVLNESENKTFSLEQGLLHIQKKKNIKSCKLVFRYTQEELKKLLEDAKVRLTQTVTSDTTSADILSKRKQQRK